MLLPAKIKTWFKRRCGAPTIEFALERLAQTGFQPELIFDGGAYRGDFSRTCREIWRNAEIACFEVQVEPLEHLNAIFANDPNVRVWPCLLGRAIKEGVTFHLAGTASSVLEEQGHQNFATGRFPMRTVDDLVEREYGGRSPALLKLDVQGYELEVLRGAENSLKLVQVILMEVNLIDLYCDVPLLPEVMQWLAERGWVAYDICGLTRRPLDFALWQADMIFVPKISSLRADKRYNGCPQV